MNAVVPAASRRVLQALLAPGADHYLAKHLRTWVPDAVGARAGLVLDVGSGSESRLARITRTVAVDVSLGRVAAAARTGAMAVVASAAALPFRDNCFRVVVGIGLLHHLSDDDATRAVCEMTRVTAGGGHTAVLDAVLPEPAWRRPVAAVIRRLDRGAWMRRQRDLEAILGTPGGWSRERITYAYTGLEALIARRRKDD